MKYLMIEDSTDVILHLIPILEIRGFEVYAKIDKLSIVCPWVSENRPEFIQLDGLDGRCFEFYDVLASVSPESNILIYSGDPDVEERARSESRVFIPKFTSPDNLLEYIGGIRQ